MIRALLPFAVAGVLALVPSASAGRAHVRAQAAADNPGGSGWGATASGFQGRDGERFVYTCPKYGSPATIWGTDIYTDDSSVCVAAVHAGLIGLAGGGTVTIEIRPGEASYTGSTRNRITSSSYPAWSGSYVIVAATPEDPGVGAGGSDWSATASGFRNYVGARFSFNCPANGTPRTIWGTDAYTDDSSVCTAAVHAGAVKVASGGRVTIEMLDGRASYRGSKRYGVTSQPYGAWGGSFLVVDAPGGPDEPNGVATGSVLVNGRAFSAGPVRYGSTVDVTHGTLNLTAKGAGTILVYGDGADLARFVLKKSVERVGARKRTTAELALAGGDLASCGASGSARAAAGASQKVVRALWSDGKGRFRTKGRFSSATIRGTTWFTADRCDGTLTTVKTGTVVVRDFKRKKSLALGAGKSYLAT